MTVPMLPDAKEVFRDLGSEITNELREARGTAFTAILARIAENAQKLALVRAVGLDPEAVCTENLVRIELVMESRHAWGDDRPDLPGPQPSGCSLQVQKPT